MRTTSASFRISGACAALVALCFSATALADEQAAGGAPAGASAPANSLRPEVGLPLKDAQSLAKERKFKEAMAKIKEAEAVPGRTAYENSIITQLRTYVAQASGDDEAAIASLESQLNGGHLSPKQQADTMRIIASTYAKAKNYPKAATWYNRIAKELGDPTATDNAINCLYQANDFAGAAAQAKEANDADERAGRTPSEQRLQVLLNAQMKTKDAAGETGTIERLLTHYPKRDYWELAISHASHRAGFADRLDPDLLRLRFALGDLKKSSEYIDLAKFTLGVHFPVEAKKVLDQGFAAGLLGKGADAERDKKVQAVAVKDSAERAAIVDAADYADTEAAKGPEAAMDAGYNLVLNGKADKGLALMEATLKKGGLKHAEDARLHFGLALNIAGQKARAIEVFKSVKGGDGTADLGHLWALHLAH